jgi:hypothetical protein
MHHFASLSCKYFIISYDFCAVSAPFSHIILRFLRNFCILIHDFYTIFVYCFAKLLHFERHCATQSYIELLTIKLILSNAMQAELSEIIGRTSDHLTSNIDFLTTFVNQATQLNPDTELHDKIDQCNNLLFRFIQLNKKIKEMLFLNPSLVPNSNNFIQLIHVDRELCEIDIKSEFHKNNKMLVNSLLMKKMSTPPETSDTEAPDMATLGPDTLDVDTEAPEALEALESPSQCTQKGKQNRYVDVARAHPGAPSMAGPADTSGAADTSGTTGTPAITPAMLPAAAQSAPQSAPAPQKRQSRAMKWIELTEVEGVQLQGNVLRLPVVTKLTHIPPTFYWFGGDSVYKPGIYSSVCPGFYVKAAFPDVLPSYDENFKRQSLKCKYYTRELCTANKRYIAAAHDYHDVKTCNYVHKNETFIRLGTRHRCAVESVGNHKTLDADLSNLSNFDIKHMLMSSLGDDILSAIWYQNKFKNGNLVLSNLNGL